MMKELNPVFVGDYQQAALIYSYLAGDDLHPVLTPNVRSEPLQDPGAHGVKSQFSQHIVLVPPDEQDRARELVEDFQKGPTSFSTD